MGCTAWASASVALRISIKRLLALAASRRQGEVPTLSLTVQARVGYYSPNATHQTDLVDLPPHFALRTAAAQAPGLRPGVGARHQPSAAVRADGPRHHSAACPEDFGSHRRRPHSGGPQRG